MNAIYPADKLGTRDRVFIINADHYKSFTPTPVRDTHPPAPNRPVRRRFPRWLPPTTTGLASTRTSRTPRGPVIALVGDGAVGQLCAAHVDRPDEAQVTVIDRLPTPGGLVRCRVAPDHPGTKGVPTASTCSHRDPRSRHGHRRRRGRAGPVEITQPAELAARPRRRCSTRSARANRGARDSG